MANENSEDSDADLEAERRDLMKGLLVGGAATDDARSQALNTIFEDETNHAEPDVKQNRGHQPAQGQQGTGPDPIPVRATGSVSMREVVESTPLVSGPSVSIRDAARHRDLLDFNHNKNPRTDPPFAFRELITSQKITDTSLIRRYSFTHNSKWHNWVNDHYNDNMVKYQPSSKRDLVEAVLFTAREEERIRAVGSGHSHSNAAAPEEHFLQLSWYDSSNNDRLTGLIDDLQHKWTGATLTDDLVRVEAGATIKYLNRGLLKKQDKALLNMGSYDAQTLAGAINTSTHGTGAQLGALSDTVRSVDLVTVMESPAQPSKPIVRTFRVEPSTGITDREDFEDDVGDHGMTLIQDDDVFHSVVAGYGCMGVAYAYTIDVRDKFFLDEDREYKRWNQLKGDIQDYIAEPDYSKSYKQATGARHFQFLVNIADVDENDYNNPLCHLISHREYHKYSGTSNFSAWPSKPSWWSSQGMNWPPERTGKTFARKAAVKVKGKGFNPTNGVFPPMPSLIDGRFKNDANDQQFEFDSGSRSILAASTPKGDKTASYVALRRKTENHPDPYTEPQPPPMAISTEIAVPADQVDIAVEEAFEAIKESDWAFHIPMGVRFVARSSHFLTPEYKGPNDRDVPVAKVEVPFIVEPVKRPAVTMQGQFKKKVVIPQQQMLGIGKAAMQDVEDRLVTASDQGKLDFARPHMGKTNTISDLDEYYDRFGTWQAVHEAFDAFGVFNNGFTDSKNIDT